jgi:hypothetical protein
MSSVAGDRKKDKEKKETDRRKINTQMKFGMAANLSRARFCMSAHRRWVQKAKERHRSSNWIWVCANPIPWRMVHAPTRRE